MVDVQNRRQKNNTALFCCSSVKNEILFIRSHNTPAIPSVLERWIVPHDSSASFLPLSLLLGDDFSAYELLISLHSPRRYTTIARDDSSWRSVLCSAPKLRSTFQLLPATNATFLSRFMCRELTRNPNRVSLFKFVGDAGLSHRIRPRRHIRREDQEVVGVERLRERLLGEVCSFFFSFINFAVFILNRKMTE